MDYFAIGFVLIAAVLVGELRYRYLVGLTKMAKKCD